MNAAALGEATYGAAKGLDSCLYITIGTGIGAGAIVQGKLLQGLSHPEMGHILVRRHPHDEYQGKCPYHRDCLEGLAAGPAIEERWGAKGVDLVDRPEVWELQGYYIAQALMQYVLILSPKKIILGGGVMNQKQLFPSIYKYLKEFVADYVFLPELSDYIVSPGLGDHAGITGSLMLAKQALQENINTVEVIILQPLFLKPVFKERIWGGTALATQFGYDIPTDQTGECWAISAHPNGPSIIENGPYAGMALDELWKKHPELFGNPKEEVFPLVNKNS